MNILGLKRKPKKTEDIQGSILEALANRRKGASKLQNWGAWIAKEVEEISDDEKRTEVQKNITDYVLENK